MDAPQEHEYRAEFPLVRQAAAFVAHLVGPGWSIVPNSLKQTGRVVTWRSLKPPVEPGQTYYEGYEWSMAETVGFFGSASTGRKAKINGRNAPASY